MSIKIHITLLAPDNASRANKSEVLYEKIFEKIIIILSILYNRLTVISRVFSKKQ